MLRSRRQSISPWMVSSFGSRLGSPSLGSSPVFVLQSFLRRSLLPSFPFTYIPKSMKSAVRYSSSSLLPPLLHPLRFFSYYCHLSSRSWPLSISLSVGLIFLSPLFFLSLFPFHLHSQSMMNTRRDSSSFLFCLSTSFYHCHLHVAVFVFFFRLTTQRPSFFSLPASSLFSALLPSLRYVSKIDEEIHTPYSSSSSSASLFFSSFSLSSSPCCCCLFFLFDHAATKFPICKLFS